MPVQQDHCDQAVPVKRTKRFSLAVLVLLGWLFAAPQG